MEKEYKRSEDSQITITDLMLPSHSNFSGKIHGGHILNLMDQVAFACASKHSRNYCVTASVNKVDFLNSVEVGELLTMKASVNYTGRTSMEVGVRVEAENIQSGYVKHCNSSYFTMVAKDADGNNAEVPGLILHSVDDIRRFSRSIKRKEQAKQRQNLFKDKDFVVEEYIELLKSHNAKIDLQES